MEPITRQTIEPLLPVRMPSAHKGVFGRVLVVAGSRTMCGAGFLCAKSALRAGAGLVYWALPQTMQPTFAAALPDAITWPLPENENGEIAGDAWPVLQQYIDKHHPTVLVAGPGMGQSPLLPLLLRECPLPLVLDGDGLNALARLPGISFKQPVIFTPHPGEMARLLDTAVVVDESFRALQAAQWTEQTGGVSVLKGPGTVVAVCRQGKTLLWQNTTGGVSLAKAGSGDVLAGAIAGLWAQLGGTDRLTTDTALRAALCGVYIHGLAGDLAARKNSDYGVLAHEVADCLPLALKQILQKEPEK